MDFRSFGGMKTSATPESIGMADIANQKSFVFIRSSANRDLFFLIFFENGQSRLGLPISLENYAIFSCLHKFPHQVKRHSIASAQYSFAPAGM